MPDVHDRIRASFGAQGLMATLGAQLVQVTPGEVRIALLPRPQLSQQNGYVHAGAISSVLDSACGYAALTQAAADSDVLTVEFKINFVRPALAERFVAIGRVVKPGTTLIVCQGEVIGEQGSRTDTIAIMQATIMQLAAGR